jgi:hypothetical protein
MPEQSAALRYAIYFVPRADTALYEFGTSVLGYDAYTGQRCDLIEGTDGGIWNKESWDELVREPGVYGFHGTLKPPFYLAAGTDEALLDQAFTDFAASRRAVIAGELAVQELGGFIALVPKSPCPPLDDLAQACVWYFDRFRAPMSKTERARRVTPALSDRQIENLDRCGYPYVLGDFRFHMTLTGRLSPPLRGGMLRFLRNKFEQLPASNALVIDQIVVARQSGSMPFQVMRTASLLRSA